MEKIIRMFATYVPIDTVCEFKYVEMNRVEVFVE